MIDSVLKDIREAEEKAEQLQKEAYQRGKELVLNAEAEAEAQKRATVRDCKEERKAALQEARRISLDKAQVIFKKGTQSAAAMAEQKNPVIEDTAVEVLAMLIGKYVGQEENVTDEQTELDGQSDAE